MQGMRYGSHYLQKEKPYHEVIEDGLFEFGFR